MVIGYSEEEHNGREEKEHFDYKIILPPLTWVTKLRVGITSIWNFRIWSSPVHPKDSYGDDLGNHRKCQALFRDDIKFCRYIWVALWKGLHLYARNTFNLWFAMVENVSALG